MRYTISIITILFCVISNAQAGSLSGIKGVKWKQELPPRDGPLKDKVYGRLVRPKDSNGNYLGFDRIVDQLAAKGVQAVAFRIDKPDRYVDENGKNDKVEMKNYHNELATVIPKLSAKNIDTYLWVRIWLTNNNDKKVFKRFDHFLKDHSAARNQIRGLAITEHQLTSMNTVKSRAIGIVNYFNNSKYSNYLKTRNFIMPGLDNGINFQGVNQNDNFHNDMRNKVDQFAFAVKTMKKKNSDGDPRYADYNKYMRNSSSTVAEREQWLIDNMRLNALITYQNRNSYNSVNHVIYWGDEGDAMTNVHPKAATAVHNLIYGTRTNGHFFYATIADSTMELERVQAKSILMYNTSNDSISKNNMKHGKWSGSVGTFDQFNNWSSSNPGY